MKNAIVAKKSGHSTPRKPSNAERERILKCSAQPKPSNLSACLIPW